MGSSDGEPGEIQHTNAPDKVFDVATGVAGAKHRGDPEWNRDCPLNGDDAVCWRQEEIEQEFFHAAAADW